MPGRYPLLFAAALITALACAPARSAPAGPGSDDAYLDDLQGRWVMAGTVGDMPVQYQAKGQRVLQGGFLSLHMRDAAPDPQYEATVYLGYDAKAGDFVAHWLDRFGAAGARVVATGRRQGEQLVLIFPYHDGAFRDTFTRDRDRGSWTLLLEAQAGDGSWSTFASYALVRPPGRRH
jgi:hypothetical protein